MPPNSSWRLPRISWGRPARSALNRSTRRSSSGNTLYLPASSRNSRCSSAQLLGLLRGQVVGLGPVVGVVQLPDVVVEGGQLGADDPRGAVAGHRRPALVVDAPVAEHLEVLGLVALGGVGVVEAVGHATPCSGCCWTPLTIVGSGSPATSRTVGGDVDDVVELVADLALGLRSRRASARWCRCGCRPSGRRPAWSTGTACPWRGPSRRRSGCRPRACRTRRSARP